MQAASKDLIVHVGDYPLRQQDGEQLFHGKRLIYLSW